MKLYEFPAKKRFHWKKTTFCIWIILGNYLQCFHIYSLIIVCEYFRSFDRIIAASSSNLVHLYDLNNNNGFTQLQKFDKSPITSENAVSICGIRIANENPNTIFIAQGENIYIYDIRSNPSQPAQTFHNEALLQKQFTCFDVNNDDTILCAGTEQTNGEAHLLLIDVRKWSILSTYTDSHGEDLTQVKFHRSKPNVLASGSTDGLMNVFNVSETDEDEALEYCLNTESSVQAINWHTSSMDEKDYLSCITDTNDFHLYDVEESELVFDAKRDKITKRMKRTRSDDCYLINCHNAANDDIFLLAGSNSNAGQCLRSLTVQGKKLKPRNNFIDNKQIVRCSVFNAKVNFHFSFDATENILTRFCFCNFRTMFSSQPVKVA